MKKQTIEGMKEWLESPGGHYFLTPAETQDVLDMQTALEATRKLAGELIDILETEWQQQDDGLTEAQSRIIFDARADLEG